METSGSWTRSFLTHMSMLNSGLRDSTDNWVDGLLIQVVIEGIIMTDQAPSRASLRHAKQASHSQPCEAPEAI